MTPVSELATLNHIVACPRLTFAVGCEGALPPRRRPTPRVILGLEGVGGGWGVIGRGAPLGVVRGVVAGAGAVRGSPLRHLMVVFTGGSVCKKQ